MSVEIPYLSASDSSASLSVSESVFEKPYNESLIHQLVTRYLAGGRAGTKAQKSRSDVSGGGAKPWRQKGTGRARAGTSRGPIWRGGGVTFAASPRNFKQKLNKKMYRGGMRSIFSELLRQERLFIDNEIALTDPKTKALAGYLKQWRGKRMLLVTGEVNANLELASKNLAGITVLSAGSVDPVSLVGAELILLTEQAAKVIEERLA